MSSTENFPRKKRRTVTCSNCREKGHTVRSCKNDPWEPEFPYEGMVCFQKQDRICKRICFQRQGWLRAKWDYAHHCSKKCSYFGSDAMSEEI